MNFLGEERVIEVNLIYVIYTRPIETLFAPLMPFSNLTMFTIQGRAEGCKKGRLYLCPPLYMSCKTSQISTDIAQIQLKKIHGGPGRSLVRNIFSLVLPDSFPSVGKQRRRDPMQDKYHNNYILLPFLTFPIKSYSYYFLFLFMKICFYSRIFCCIQGGSINSVVTFRTTLLQQIS